MANPITIKIEVMFCLSLRCDNLCSKEFFNFTFGVHFTVTYIDILDQQN